MSDSSGDSSSDSGGDSGGESGGGYDSEYSGVSNTNGCLGFAIFLITTAIISSIFKKYFGFGSSENPFINLPISIFIISIGLMAYFSFTNFYKK
ncbi:MAG: hypothetical protein H7263_07930 [Candidatus Sericytochromatia bacterium]|nr:hypothetical protein [Candidatus Sericytochromatia bacterium]